MAAKPDVTAAAKDIAAVLGVNVPYAVVGGGACRLLGGPRTTDDVDVVVPQGEVVKTKNMLRDDSSKRFTVDRRTRHTKHAATGVDIDVLAPPGTFKEPFDKDTPTQLVQGVRVLPPLALLNAKCGSILGRGSQAKKETDGQDIVFLLRYCKEHDLKVTTGNVPNAIPEIVEVIAQSDFVPRTHWEQAGYDFTTQEWQ